MSLEHNAWVSERLDGVLRFHPELAAILAGVPCLELLVVIAGVDLLLSHGARTDPAVAYDIV